MFESLWGVLEERNVFLHQHVLEKEWLKIPLATVKDCICCSQDTFMLDWPQKEALAHHTIKLLRF